MSDKYIMYDPAEFDKIEINHANDADEITCLREKDERLQEALKLLIEIENYPDTILMERIRRARAALEGVKKPLWQHKKTGGIYEIVGECQIEATNTPGVLYRNTSTGVTWVRPKDEFFDGRFEKVKLTLSAIRDLIKPGFSEERLWVDFIEEKLMMGDNFILIDDKKCLSYDDQQDMLKQNIEKWRNK